MAWPEPFYVHTRRNAASIIEINFQVRPLEGGISSFGKHSSLSEWPNGQSAHFAYCIYRSRMSRMPRCEQWLVYSTSITASLKPTSCKILILATGNFSTILLLLTYHTVVGWDPGWLIIDLPSASLSISSNSLAFRLDCDLTCQSSAHGLLRRIMNEGRWNMPCGVAWVC